MPKPTKEQIEAWHQEATGGTKTLDLPCFAKLAFAAGRKSTMEEACRIIYSYAGSDNSAQRIVDAVKAAMGDEK